MGIDSVALMKSILEAQRIDIRQIRDAASDLEDFDRGIRRLLFVDYDYRQIAEQIMLNCKDHFVYVITDIFEVHYIVFKRFLEDGKQEYIMIGPYVSRNNPIDVKDTIRRLDIDLFHMQTLQNYYYEIPVIDNIEQIVFIFVQNLFPSVSFQIDRTGLLLRENYDGLPVRLDNGERLSMSGVEERYAIEDALVEAVGQGDTAKAYYYLGKFGDYKVEPRSADSLRNGKNLMIVLNTLFRAEVHRAKVHPVYVDEMSGAFAKRIENCRNVFELNKILAEMVRKYCLLVQNHSLKGYSENIERVINYIDFHLSEPLGLNFLADCFNVNASYLSRTFKKETGKTLTDYLNERRIEKSLVFLSMTNLPIQEVAAQVGIYDDNYFSRIFKKFKNISPREYRSMMTRGGEKV